MWNKKKLLYLVIISVVALSACSGKPKASQKAHQAFPPDSLVVPYDDDKFSLLLPKGWTWETDTCDTWLIKHIVDSLNITSGIVELFPPDNSLKIRLVKGVTRWILPDSPASAFASFSQMRASKDSTCIFISDITDSISVDGHDACSVVTAYDYDGDTIIQDQYVVIKDKYDLYYLNGLYDIDDNKASILFHKILSTIKLK